MAVWRIVLLSKKVSHSLQGQCSSGAYPTGASKYKRNKRGMFYLNNSLLIFSSLFIFMFSVAGLDLGSLV